MDDNLSLSEKIKARYRSMYSGVFFLRYIKGLWAVAEGVIYDMFDKDRHVVDSIELPQQPVYYVSCDYGTQNATVFLLWCKHLTAVGHAPGNIITVAEIPENRRLTASLQMT